ncbi:MAG TPA: hypothetical protein VHX88_08700 [Solirubrobacteraceae bacterium]|jgi:hypothetical protein|nr:hypothetical protein [Solirubrobacteraceae bacterium]
MLGLRAGTGAPAAARPRGGLGASVGERAREHPGELLAAALAALWLCFGLPTPDLAAQYYRVQLFTHGTLLWDNNWYAGHNLPGYSLVFPPLAGAIGLRLCGALAAVGSTVLFGQLVSPRYPSAARAACCWFAVGACCDLVIGRLTYALGVTVGLGAAYALSRARSRSAAGLSALCAATSPVTGLFLALGGMALCLGGLWRRGVALLVPALVVVGVLVVLFPEGGYEPFAGSAFWATLSLSLAVLCLVPAREGVLRWGAGLYMLAVLLSAVVHTPMGGNVERLGVEFGGPLLLCGRASAAATPRRRAPGLWLVAVVALTCVGLACWELRGPVLEEAKGEDASAYVGYYRPLERWLSAHAAGPVRLEVTFTRSHWDAAYLAERFALARGWERQLDGRYDALFYSSRLTSAAYRAWLLEQGVDYVALADAPLDDSSRAEAALIRGGLPYLRLVWRGAHWRLYRVLGASSLADGPGALVALRHSSFTLSARAAGTFLVRVHYTGYWSLPARAGCVAEAPGPSDFTLVRVSRPGVVTVRARFSPGALLGRGSRCS